MPRARASTPRIALRRPRPGELGWVVSRHGAIYAAEHGWDERFEALVAGIVAGFVKNFDPARDRCWIASRAGRPVGSVFLVAKTRRTARLRMLLVEPRARGLGIGRRLVAACLRFARSAGYAEVELWTNSALERARRIYEAAGFRLASQTPDALLGGMSQVWKLRLPPLSSPR
jgi:GNAT superfamily N-acetyltransferase